MSNLLPNFTETKEQRTFRQNYMRAINKAYRYDESIGIMDIGEDKKISLQDIYVPLRFNTHDSEDTENLSTSLSIIELFKRNNKVVLSGKPGSGKTTLSRSIINALSNENLTTMAQNFGRRLPIYIKLRDYKIDNISNFNMFLNEYIKIIENTLKIKVSLKEIEFYLKNGWCFLIFDGVDEVGNEKNRLKIRDFILKNFTNYNSSNYILITSRPKGLDKSYFFNHTKNEKEKIKKYGEEIDFEELIKNNFKIEEIEEIEEEVSFPSLYYVTSFNDKQIKQYSQNWFKLREENSIVIDEKVDDFTTSIEKIKNLSILRRRPVFLSMMIHIHTTKGKLPYSRAMAYRYMVEAYIEHIDIARRLNKYYTKDWSFEDKERVLEGIAYKLHSSVIEINSEKNVNTEESESIQIILSKNELRKTIKQIIEDEDNIERWQTVEKGEEDALLEFYISRTGLLHEPEENKIQFSHLSFQEYLTAHFIYKKVIEKPFEIRNTIQNEILNKLDDTKWNEVILLFFSLYKDATDSILEVFYKENNNSQNKDFINLILNLLDSREYGIKESKIEKWVNRIIDFLPNIKEDKTQNRDSVAYQYIERLLNNSQVQESSLENYGIKILQSLINEKRYKESENILYLLSSLDSISPSLFQIIESNIENFSDTNLKVPMELFTKKIPSLHQKLYKSYSLNEIIALHTILSSSCKENFIQEFYKDWRFYFLRIVWKVIRLYTNIEFNKLLNYSKKPYSVDKFIEFQYKQYQLLSINWQKYWFANVWHGDKNGFEQHLNQDKLYHNYKWFIDYSHENAKFSFESRNNFLNDELKEIEESLSQHTNKLNIFGAIATILFTTEEIEKNYKIDLSIPWKTYDEFKEFKKTLFNNDLLYNYLEEKTKIPIDKEEFKAEINEYMNKDYSIKQLINIILENKTLYKIHTYQECKNLILNKEKAN